MLRVSTMTDGQLVEHWRSERGWTQEQLAEEVTKVLRKADPSAGITRNAVAMWEQGRNGLTEPNRRALIKALGLTSAEFYEPETKKRAVR